MKTVTHTTSRNNNIVGTFANGANSVFDGTWTVDGSSATTGGTRKGPDGQQYLVLWVASAQYGIPVAKVEQALGEPLRAEYARQAAEAARSRAMEMPSHEELMSGNCRVWARRAAIMDMLPRR